MTSGTPAAGWVDDYLARIGLARPVSADPGALRDLQTAHLLAVPFENLSIHLRELIVLDQAALVTKVAGPPFDHMALRVDLTEPWLADVGFGRFAMRPLRLTFPGDQPDPSGTFLVAESPSGHGDLDIFHDGRPAYRVDPRPYALPDFAPTCWWQQTDPGSHFRESLTCSISTRPAPPAHQRSVLLAVIASAEGLAEDGGSLCALPPVSW